MSDKEKTDRVFDNGVYVALSLFTLVTFVVAQSVYQVLASNPEFLAVRQVRHRHLLEIIAVFNLLPALLLYFLWAICRRSNPGLARGFLAVVNFLLFLCFLMQVHNTYLRGFPHARVVYPVWVFLAATLGFASLRFEKSFRSFILVLSPVILVFPGLFLFRVWKATAEWSHSKGAVAQQTVSPSAKKSLPPVFVVVFDEFGLDALIDRDGQIDGDRFPNFRSLASGSYWFRNATANADETTLSLPVILTGNFPRGIDPSFEAYPNNLLSLLHPYQDIYVHELVTHFCNPELFHCPDAETKPKDGEILKDVSSLYAARVLPNRVSARLGNMDTSWGPFGDSRDELKARMDRFQSFVASLGSPANERAFHFFYHMLPHSPYMLTSEGTIYVAQPDHADPSFVGNSALLGDLRQRYLMQVAFVDKELGQLVGQLKQSGLYDKSLILVTADHGVSFKTEAPGRPLTTANADKVLPVPLFIKIPFQKRGVASDLDVQHIDVAPTLASLLGLQIPWPHAGRDIFSVNEVSRQKIAYTENPPGVGHAFPNTLGLTAISGPPAALESPLIGQKIATFDVAPDLPTTGYMDPLPASPLFLGRQANEFPIEVDGWAVRPDTGTVPALIAVAVNGEIVAVTSPCCERPDVAKQFGNNKLLRCGWRATFSTRRLRDEVNAITTYAVVSEKDKILDPLQAAGGDVIQAVHTRGGETQASNSLLGKWVDSLSVRDYEGISGYLDDIPTPNVRIHSKLDKFPIQVRGWAVLTETQSVPNQIAVALNGQIVAVTSPCCERPDIADHFYNRELLRSGWATVVSSEKLREGNNQVTAYAVLDSETGKLARLLTKGNTIHVDFK